MLNQSLRECIKRNKQRDPMLCAFMLRNALPRDNDLWSLCHNMQKDGCHSNEIDWLVRLVEKEFLARRVDKISGAGDMHSDSHRLIRRVKTLREMFYRFLSLRDALTWVRGAYYRGGKGEVK